MEGGLYERSCLALLKGAQPIIVFNDDEAHLFTLIPGDESAHEALTGDRRTRFVVQCAISLTENVKRAAQ